MVNGKVLMAVGAVVLSGVGQMRAAEMRLAGPFGDRLERMVRNHVEATDAKLLADVFTGRTRETWWQTEFWGKYMHSAAPFWRYTGDATLKARMDESMRQIVAHQLPDGYIGNYRADARSGKGWDVWGNKYTMLGLLHYYDVTGDRTALDAAAKLCDYASAGDTWQEDSAYRVWLPTVLPLPERSSAYRAGTPIVSASYLDGRTTAANHR